MAEFASDSTPNGKGLKDTTVMSEYRTTREQCQANIKGVCSGCGGQLAPIETVDNAKNPTFWPGCLQCSQFDYGVDERIFRVARKLVEDRRLRPYSHIDNDAPRYVVDQTRGATGIVADVLRVAREVGLVPASREVSGD